MGSYGIGPTRLIAAIIEASHDENGIIWPESVAPFDIGLINMKPGDADCDRVCDELCRSADGTPAARCSTTTPTSAPARKFATADLIGLPWQVIVGPRGVAAGEVEIKNRRTGERETIAIGAVARGSAGHDERSGKKRQRARGRSRTSSGWSPGAICAPSARRP